MLFYRRSGTLFYNRHKQNARHFNNSTPLAMKNKEKIFIGSTGTGKTFNIVQRISSLMNESDPPSKVLALTFSDLSAKKLQYLVDVKSPLSHNVIIKPFRFFINSLLREVCGENYKSLNMFQTIDRIKPNLSKLPIISKFLQTHSYNLKQLIKYFIELRDMNVTLERYHEMLNNNSSDKTVQYELYQCYQEFLQFKNEYRNIIDIRDQIEYMSQFTTKNPNQWINLYKHIFIDDLQDCSFSQMEFFEKFLSKDLEEITVTIDDDQAQYGIGNHLQTIKKFCSIYPKADIITLSDNYRNSQQIIEASHRLISHNPKRLENLFGIKKLSECVNTFDNNIDLGIFQLQFAEGEEENGIALKIIDLLNKHPQATIGVITPQNSDILKLNKVFKQHNLPIQSSDSYWEEPEVQFIVKLLNCIIYPSNSNYIYDLLVTPVENGYSIASDELTKIMEIHLTLKIPLRIILDNIATGVPMSFPINDNNINNINNNNNNENNNNKVYEWSEETIGTSMTIIRDIKYLENNVHVKTTSELIYEIIKKRGMIDRYRKPTTTNSEIQASHITSLFKEINNLEVNHNTTKAPFIISHLNSTDRFFDVNLDDFQSNETQVVVSNIYTARHLEFDYVFLYHFTEDKFSTSLKNRLEFPQSLIENYELFENDQFIKEQRRRLYISMTRSRNSVYCTYTNNSRLSRLIYESLNKPIPPNHFTKFMFNNSNNNNTDISSYINNNNKKGIDIAKGPVLPNLQLEVGGTYSTEIKTITMGDIISYIKCPLQYCYSKPLNLSPAQPTITSIRGLILYDFLMKFLQNRQQQVTIDSDQLLNNISHFTSLSEDEQQIIKETVNGFINKHKEMVVPNNLIIGKEFTINIADVEITGKIDRIHDYNRIVMLTQFQQSMLNNKKIPKRLTRERNNIELLFSSWAFNKINNKIPQSSRSQTIDVDGTLGTTDELIAPHITELNSFEQLLINSINGIKTGSFQAKPDYKTCRSCNYHKICPSSKVHKFPM